MEYVINVARPGTLADRNFYGSAPYIHYFKAIVPYGSVKKVYTELKERYPDCKIDVYAYQTTGTEVNMDECDF